MGVCHADDLFYLFDPVFGLPPDLLTGEVLNDKYLPFTCWKTRSMYRQSDRMVSIEILRTPWSEK